MSDKKHNKKQDDCTKEETQTTEEPVQEQSQDQQLSLAELLKEQIQHLEKANKKLEQKATSALQLAAEYKEDMQRMKKRSAEVEEEKTKKVVEDTALKLIPVLDNLMLATDKCQNEQIQKGFKLIQEQFEKVLAEMDVVRVKTKEFNPKYHEAISTMPAQNSKQKNKIAFVLKEGYTHGEKTIRPAQVVVYN